MSQRFYRPGQLVNRPGHPPGLLPISTNSLWRWVRDGKFPQPFKLGEQTTVFDADEVDRWLKAQKDIKPTGRSPVAVTARPDAKRPGRPRKVEVQ